MSGTASGGVAEDVAKAFLLISANNLIIYLFRGVAQLVARLLWEQDAAGSSPVTPTKKRNLTQWGFFFYYCNQKDLNLKKARGVKKTIDYRF